MLLHLNYSGAPKTESLHLGDRLRQRDAVLEHEGERLEQRGVYSAVIPNRPRLFHEGMMLE